MSKKFLLAVRCPETGQTVPLAEHDESGVLLDTLHCLRGVGSEATCVLQERVPIADSPNSHLVTVTEFPLASAPATGVPPALPITDLIQLPPEERCSRVLHYAFGGEHRVSKLEKFPHPKWPYWTFNVHLGGSLATEDADQLTRLVVAATEYGVRAELSSAGPRYVKVHLHPRFAREGCFSQRVQRLVDHANSFDLEQRLFRANVEAGALHPGAFHAAGPREVVVSARQMRAAMQAEIEAGKGFEHGDTTIEQLEAAQCESRRAQQAFEACVSGAPLRYYQPVRRVDKSLPPATP